MEDTNVVIVGGSITGPVLANLFARVGFRDVTVLEATPPTVSPAGGVIGLDHASLGVLDTIGVPQSEVVPFTSERVVSVQVANRREVGRSHTMWPGRNAVWTLLNRALVSRLPGGWYRPGARVTGVDVGSDGRAVVSLRDREPVSAGLVAFADGRRSVGRWLLDPGRELRYAGYVAHRGITDGRVPGLRDFTRYETGSTQFNVTPVRLPDGRVAADWTLYLPMPAGVFRERHGTDPTRRTFMLPHQIGAATVRDVNDTAAQLLPDDAARMVHDTAFRMAAPVVDIDPPTRMVYRLGVSRAVLVGDALAPVRPHTARGANNGIDQAAGLVTAMGQHVKHDADLDAALAGWEQRFLPMVQRSIDMGPRMAQQIGLG